MIYFGKFVRVLLALSTGYFVVPIYSKPTSPNVTIPAEMPRLLTNDEKKCPEMRTKNICPNPNITYWLYTKDHYSNPYRMMTDNITTFTQAPFRIEPGTPIQILLHGYNGDMHDSPNSEIRPEYLYRKNDVVSVNYPNIVKYPCIKEAKANVHVIGRCVAKFIRKLLHINSENRKISKENLHVIGFSLGAHIAGVAGSSLHRSGQTLPRITALDPLLPILYGVHNQVDRHIASFVDVIHTNTKMRGHLQHLGHADFYVNDPIYYGNCENDFDRCNTGMAPTYYAESINNNLPYCGFNHNITGNGAIMGEHIPFCTKGVFGVITSKFRRLGHGCNNCTVEPKYVRVFRLKDLTIKSPDSDYD